MSWLNSLKLELNYYVISILCVSLGVFLCTSIYRFAERQTRLSVLNRIPGPKPFPILGNTLELKLKGGDRHFSKHSVRRTKWKQRRKLLTPAFHFKILEDFIDVFNQKSFKFVSNLEVNLNGKPFDIFPYVTLCALDIILEWVNSQLIVKYVLGDRKPRLAFLDLLLESAEENEDLSDEDIREEVDTFMFAGHDTVAASLNWTLYLLGCHPSIQNKVYEELEAIFGKSDRAAASSDIREMKYLECCIKESLRLFPSVPIYGRELKENLVVGEYVIPKETNVFVIAYQLHRDPDQFPDPNSFKPERFLSENSVKRNPYAYVPFGAGSRNCIENV
ncbi:Cytochrome P450 4C1 [Armadillidium nasatum]|uniref:Cytochrome P450 4C1 n=1 Tax=Armadillidium nasatum TaxID=96803 RepID=A0A5N5TFX4_9CRUS|nr:Cytochrome P450 4C1 [Armadillidium nasatum]